MYIFYSCIYLYNVDVLAFQGLLIFVLHCLSNEEVSMQQFAVVFLLVRSMCMLPVLDESSVLQFRAIQMGIETQTRSTGTILF